MDASHHYAAGPLRCNLKRREGGVKGRTGSRDWLRVSAGSRRLRLLDTPLKGRVNCRAALGRLSRTLSSLSPPQPVRTARTKAPRSLPNNQALDMSKQGRLQTSFMDFTLFSQEGPKGFNYFCSSLIRV